VTPRAPWTVEDALGELRAELTVEPRGDFQARVRDRLELEGRRPWVFARWVSSAVGVAAVGLLLVAWPRETARENPAAARSSPATVAQRTGASPAPAAIEPPAAPSARRPARRVAVARVGPDAPSLAPDLRVITTQPDVLRRLWNRPVDASVVMPDPLSANWPVTLGRINVPQIVVEPIVVSGVGDAPAGGGSPVIRRLTREHDTRSFR
jgi:hypothetical protein